MASERGDGLPREKLLTPAEIAQILGVSTKTIYEICARGELAHLSFRRRIRVEPAALQEFLDSRRREATL